MQNLGKILKQLSLDQKAILDKARIGEFLQTKYFQTELTNVTRGKPTRSKKEDFFNFMDGGGQWPRVISWNDSLTQCAKVKKAHFLKSFHFGTCLLPAPDDGPKNQQSSTWTLILKAVKKKPANPEIGRKNPKM